ncbi:MAG: 4'-phosphopantetheinyl transferase superfamily protein [Fibrobacterales bacterium]
MKYKRFKRDKARNSFAVCRGVLRLLLSHYLNTDTYSVQFVQNQFGKLFLPPSNPTIHFNVSHSHDWGMIGLSHSAPIGVDLEACKSRVNAGSIAKHYYHPEECTVLQSLSEIDALKEFYTIWSRKEAFVKAIGKGMIHPSQSYSTCYNDEKVITIEYASKKWNIQDISGPDTYSAALCTHAPSNKPIVTLLNWSALEELLTSYTC